MFKVQVQSSKFNFRHISLPKASASVTLVPYQPLKSLGQTCWPEIQDLERANAGYTLRFALAGKPPPSREEFK